MTRPTELPPGVWECHGSADWAHPVQYMAFRALCRTCGRNYSAKLPPTASAGASLDIDTADTVKTRVEPQSGGKGQLKRLNCKGQNKLETRYNTERLAGAGRYEGITFRLSNGHRYTPDWVTSNALATVCHEVKDGRYRQHSYQRARLAFDQACIEYPSIGFVWVEWNGKTWETK